ncbi:MAG: methionyl-tRNA formyltransferase [Defluviitaleaceae bacterium]|nr:methionyl-tRNA formyltransferase [Defluviitaleaceae bacterium]
MKVCFMGTPEIAIPTFLKLNKHYQVTCVVTQPDRPKGRGKKLSYPPIKEEALKLNIPIFQPEKAKSKEFISELKKINFDIIVVIAYGQILPKEILEMTKYGCINIHGSLLPKYRGASPIQTAIINGDTTSGVTIIQMNEFMDRGDIILKKEMNIENKTSGQVFTEMSFLGADALIETLRMIEKNEIFPQKQNENEATYTKILTKDMGHINFENTSKSIINLINGLNPWPTAYTFFDNTKIKIHRAEEVFGYMGNIGEVVASNPKYGIIIKTFDSAIYLLQIQPPFGKIISSQDYIKGNRIKVGSIIK